MHLGQVVSRFTTRNSNQVVTPVGLEPDIAGVRGQSPKPLEEGAKYGSYFASLYPVFR